MDSDMKLEDSVSGQATMEDQMNMDVTQESREESVMEEAPAAESEGREEGVGILLAEQMPAEVMAVEETAGQEYCELRLMIPEEYYAEFQGMEAFESEGLSVRFYDTEGTVPEIGDVLIVDVYEADSGAYLWVTMAP